MLWKKIDLEISLKSFPDKESEKITGVIRTLFRQWDQIIRQAEQTAVMLWIADGSEILEYSGELDKEFEWGKWIGVANPPVQKRPLTEAEKYPWRCPREYRKNPRTFNYRELKELVSSLKSHFYEIYGKELLVGATFDPGMEFSVSKFKYQNHHECCQGHNGRFLCCYLPLHADQKSYAGFPDGIPEGLSFGTFFGRQTQHFLTDMGMDYIWFSNGFGFGMEAWGACGAIFDGTAFYKNKSRKTHEAILGFWHDFRKECPDYPIKTRGTNFSTGIDISTDGTPLKKIYETVPGISGPPNSPSGSLDRNYALCIVNYLSHIAELPLSNSFTFRFYLHDPWFKASAWIHYYQRSPHDILLPLSLARIDKNGKIQHADAMHILSVDDSKGEMPEHPAQEVMGHILDIMQRRADKPGPFVWVYPFREYHESGEKEERLEEIYSGDYIIRGAIDRGFPLNSVVSSDNFLSIINRNPAAFDGCVLVFPGIFTVSPDVLNGIGSHLKRGGHAICYGPAHGKNIEAFLGVAPAESLEGEMKLTGFEKPVLHNSLLSGGGLDRISCDPEKNIVMAEYELNGKKRPALIKRKIAENSGELFWVRGTNSFRMSKGIYAPLPLSTEEFSYPEDLFLAAIRELGWRIEGEFRVAKHENPVMTWRRCKNAFYLAGYGRDTTSVLKLRTPDGAPLPCGSHTTVENGMTCMNTTTAIDLECRVFLAKGNPEGLVECIAALPGMPEVKRRIFIMGVGNADILYRPEPGTRDFIRFHDENGFNAPLARPDDYEVIRGTDKYGDYCLVKNVRDQLFITIPEEE